MKEEFAVSDDYAQAMGRLLVLYTQVDQFIMEACAKRMRQAPDQVAKLGLAKQVGDECRHVVIQQEWMQRFGVDPAPVVPERLLDELHRHFGGLDWVDFLTDLYLVIEALGSQAVEQVVPLADPGTRESLRIPLQDELDHVAFGMRQLKQALANMTEPQRQERLRLIPERIRSMVGRFEEIDVPVSEWFERVGANLEALQGELQRRQDELLGELAA
jgi:hypothetical protein